MSKNGKMASGTFSGCLFVNMCWRENLTINLVSNIRGKVVRYKSWPCIRYTRECGLKETFVLCIWTKKYNNFLAKVFLASKFHRGPENDWFFLNKPWLRSLRYKGLLSYSKNWALYKVLWVKTFCTLQQTPVKNVFAKKDFNLKIVS